MMFHYPIQDTLRSQNDLQKGKPIRKTLTTTKEISNAEIVPSYKGKKTRSYDRTGSQLKA